VADESVVACETEPIDTPADLATGVDVTAGAVLLGRYEVGRLLGAGGSGRVFAAFDRVLNERAALKLLRPDRAQDRSWIRRLAREVKIARLIRHPNVCRVFELGDDNGHWFITMELADGGTLRDVLRARRTSGEPPWAERLAEARAVCAGLAAIHTVGIVHRDVTPQNVLRMADGRLVLSDFGLAIGTQESTTFVGGTPRYMAPEVAAGRRADQRADVYQLGLLLHEMLFGRSAEWRDGGGGGPQLLVSPIDKDRSTPVEEEVAAVCAECLRDDPTSRPASALAVAGRLAAAEHARPRRRWSWAARFIARVGRSRVTRWVVAASLLFAVGLQAGRVALRPRPCTAGAARVGAVWGPATKQAVRGAFMRSGRASAAVTFESVTRLLDDYVRRWLAAYSDACEATQVRGEQSPAVLDLRMACLNDDLDSFAALTRVFKVADSTVVSHAAEAIAHLEDLSRCANVRLLQSEPPLPIDPATRKSAAAGFERLNEASALYDAGKYSESQAIVEDAIRIGERTNQCQLTSRALALKGYDLIQGSGPSIAQDVLKRAIFTAESCGDGRSMASAASGMVGMSLTSPAEAEMWFELGMAAVKRAGDDGRLESWLVNNLGIERYNEGRIWDALALFQRATGLKEKVLGRDSMDTQFSLNNCALVLSRLGRGEEALAMSQGSLADISKTFGQNNALYMDAVATQGTILLRLHRLADSRIAFEQVLRFAEAELPPDHWLTIEPLAGLGLIALEQGDSTAARTLLSRCLAATSQGRWLAPDLGDTRFALAKATEEDQGDRLRARTLAGEALRDYGESQDLERQVRAVRTWLEDHLPRPESKRHRIVGRVTSATRAVR
jgi:tRNA A-37 threonylcarbamoyl transferase component Bud32/tetratricopeptide (TPR) repeat protein